MDKQRRQLVPKLIIPKDLNEKYNHALTPLKMGDNSLIGYHPQLKRLDTIMYNPSRPEAMILGPQGVGKTALIEQWIYNRSYTNLPVAGVRLKIEKLGELDTKKMASRMSDLLLDMNEIKKATVKQNGYNLQMVVFIDEIHKLNNYGTTRNSVGSSAVMNALKEGLARGQFPLIGATTDYEYRTNIKQDPAFDRRFGKIIMQQPGRKDCVTIVRRRMNVFRQEGKFVPSASNDQLQDLVDYSNAYINNQAQPAKALMILDEVIGQCVQVHVQNENLGNEVTHRVLRDVFYTEVGVDIDVDADDIHLVIPPQIDKEYNHALFKLDRGKNTMIGYHAQLDMLNVAMSNPMTPNALLLGEQGIGKTALIEQWIYNRSQSRDEDSVVVVSLDVERLGALGSDLMVSRMRSLLTDLNTIYNATKEANPNKPFMMVLFIDEIHKLNNYGVLANGGEGSSGAMNALKEGLARGRFPLIGATTDYEYRQNIVPDRAFDRRFTHVVMEQPDQKATIEILKRRVASIDPHHKIEVDPTFYTQLVTYTDAYIRDQVNPAKSLSILSDALGYAKWYHRPLDHKALAFVFAGEGYDLDTRVTANQVRMIVHQRVRGQPLALAIISNLINKMQYLPRNRKKPILTAFFAGTTGTGKTETAKAFAQAYFGREDAILTLNGGDYPLPKDAALAQHMIGDSVAVNKRQVILLDEIEKSNPAVLMAYMRMIDEGIVRDSHNIERSINSTIVIATSNLAAANFAELKSLMGVNDQTNPDELTDNMITLWWQRENAMREALQAGDPHMHNGIRPEFLERFQAFVPFFPLAQSVYADIARMKLLKLRHRLQHEQNIVVKLPKPLTNAQWQELLPQSHYDHVDTVSVMISENVVGPNSKTFGARTINRFIENNVEPAIANAIANRIENNLSMDGAFYLMTNGQAVFDKNSDGGAPGVICKFKERGA